MHCDASVISDIILWRVKLVIVEFASLGRFKISFKFCVAIVISVLKTSFLSSSTRPTLLLKLIRSSRFSDNYAS